MTVAELHPQRSHAPGRRQSARRSRHSFCAGRLCGRLRDMNAAALAAVGAGCTAAGSLMTGLLLKIVDHRNELSRAGVLEVLRKKHVERYDALRRMTAAAGELQHQAGHAVRGSRYVRTVVDQRLRDMRADSRRDSDLLGGELVQAVTAYTDVIASKLKEELEEPIQAVALEQIYQAWQALLKIIEKVGRTPVV